jgi:hypothetical protein
MKWVVAHLGARMHYAIPEILFGEKALYKFYTDTYSKTHYFMRLISLLPTGLGWKKLYTRNSKFLPDHKVVSFSLFGLHYLFKLKRCKSIDCRYKTYIWAGNIFNRKINSSLVGREADFDAIYSLNSASLEVFRRYKKQKLLVLEQCIVPFSVEHDRVSKERQRHIGWENMGEDSLNLKAYSMI